MVRPGRMGKKKRGGTRAMTRTRIGLCAGGWVLLLAVGCASFDGAALFGFKGDSNELLVEGSLEAVAQSRCDQLKRLGLKAELSKNGEAFYINSETYNQVRVTLVFTREKTGDTERTRIRLQWADRSDGDMGKQILTRLEVVSPR